MLTIMDDEDIITELTDWEPDRVDGVGEPANGYNAFLVTKAAAPVSAEDRRSMASEGIAMPNGDYPIPDKEHLKSAIHLVGRSKTYSTGQVRRHVIRRAKALHATNLLPKKWTQSKKERQHMKAKKIAKAFSAAAGGVGTTGSSSDLVALLQKLGISVSLLEETLAALKDPAMLGSGAADPVPAVKAADKGGDPNATGVASDQDAIDSQRQEDSTGTAGKNKKAKRYKKKCGKLQKRIKKYRKRDKAGHFVKADKGDLKVKQDGKTGEMTVDHKADKEGKVPPESTEKSAPFTNGFAAGVNVSRDGTVSPARQVLDKLADETDPVKKARMTREVSREMISGVLGSSGITSWVQQSAGGRTR